MILQEVHFVDNDATVLLSARNSRCLFTIVSVAGWLYDSPTMAFRRFSLRGFPSEFDIRREIEGYNSSYICVATLYAGKHIRRRSDRISTGIPTERGIDAAWEKTWEFRNELLKRYRLESVGVVESIESVRKA